MLFRSKIMAYKEVARRTSRPKSVRAVGSIMAKNFDPKISCHRVIKSDGSFDNYNRGIKNKEKLLRKESAIK